jgi:hypothetical protein
MERQRPPATRRSLRASREAQANRKDTRGPNTGQIFYPSMAPDPTRTVELQLRLDQPDRRPREAQKARRRAQLRRKGALFAGALPLLLVAGFLISQSAGSGVNLTVADGDKPSASSQTATAAPGPGSTAGLGGASSESMTNPAPALAPDVTVTPPNLAPITTSTPGSTSTGTSTGSTGATASAAAALPMAAGSLVTWPSPLKNVLHDGGVSVALPDGRSLWLFGDTTQVDRTPYFFVTSSGGVTSLGSTRLTYARTSKNVPAEFLPRTAAERASGVTGSSYTAIWPTGATTVPGGDILISYAKYAVQMHPVSFTLESAGLYRYHYTGLAGLKQGKVATRIANGIWSAADGAVGSPVYAGGYVYFAECEGLHCYSLRTTPGSVTNKASYTWWTGSGWSTSRAARVAVKYGASLPAASPSISYLPAYGVYVTAGTATGHTSTTGELWVAPHPWGPWSKPIDYTLPNCPAYGCYSVQVHPLESTGGRIRVSYATSGVGPYVRVTDVPVKIASNGSAISLR